MADESEEDSGYFWLEDKKGKKRRFSEDQVKSLELMFESQTKLEPRKKLQLANELGLHPRQVAIWFQNKRARWKSKQLEREYSALKADYDALLSSFESVKNEKQALAKQLHKLAELLNKRVVEETGKEDERPSAPSTDGSDTRLMMCSDEENRCDRFRKKEAEAEAEAAYADPVVEETLVSCEQHQLFFQPSWPPDQPGTAPSHWWDFWPMNG